MTVDTIARYLKPLRNKIGDLHLSNLHIFSQEDSLRLFSVIVIEDIIRKKICWVFFYYNLCEVYTIFLAKCALCTILSMGVSTLYPVYVLL